MVDSDIKYYFLAGIVPLNRRICKVFFTHYFAEIGRQLPICFHRGWHHFHRAGQQGSRCWEKMLQAFLSHLPGPVLHYRCAGLTVSLPFLSLPSVGNQCFLMQSQYVALYFLCRDTNTPLNLHSSFSTTSPRAGHGPRPAGEGSPLLLLREWDFHSCKVVFPRWLRMYFILPDPILIMDLFWFLRVLHPNQSPVGVSMIANKLSSWLEAWDLLANLALHVLSGSCARAMEIAALLPFLLQGNHGGRFPQQSLLAERPRACRTPARTWAA